MAIFQDYPQILNFWLRGQGGSTVQYRARKWTRR